MYPAASALALRCLATLPEQRAPILAVLARLGVRPNDVAGTRYTRLEVNPCVGYFNVGEVGGGAPVRLDSWSDVLAHAVNRKAALRSGLRDLAGYFETRFEHLLGLPQDPFVWESSPFQLDLIETRPNVVVCSLHTGDLKPLVPAVLKRVLFSYDAFGVFTVAASGHLIVSRRTEWFGSSHAYRLREVLGRLAAHRLIAHATGDRFAELMPWGATANTRPLDDLTFALECLGPHAGLSFPQEESYQTMWRLAPALLAVGGAIEYGGVTTNTRGARLHPWGPAIVGTPLDEIVTHFATPAKTP